MRALTTAVTLLLLAGICMAQEPDVDETADQTVADSTGQEQRPASSALATINRILEDDQRSLREGVELGYDPGGRRDPFLSLLSRSGRLQQRGPRPEGVPGLLIDDITLQGVFMTPNGGVAQVHASAKSASYLLREGDRLYDGEVVDIRFKKDELAEVVFKQGVQDPAAIKPFREVIKTITP